MAKSFSDSMSLNGCADPWRYQHPQSREYSFFSHVHHSFSCIDYFFIDRALLPRVASSEYLPIIISDHGPLALDIVLSIQPRTLPYWRFNSLLLSDAKFCDKISTFINDFLIFNQTNSTSYSLLWESLKAYLRGQIISYSSYLNKAHKAKLDELSKAILKFDHQYALTLSSALYKQCLSLQSELDLLSTQDAERLLLRSRGTFYEHGNRASWLLAHQLKRCAASRLIPQIRDNLISDPSGINDTFKSFYSNPI